MVQEVLHQRLLHVTVAPELLVSVLVLFQVSYVVLLRPAWQCLIVAERLWVVIRLLGTVLVWPASLVVVSMLVCSDLVLGVVLRYLWCDVARVVAVF